MTSLHFEQSRSLLPKTELVVPRPRAGAVTGGVRLTLQAEGLALFVAAVAIFLHAGYSRSLFAALFMVPDLSLLGYLAGPRVGALVYNAAHSLVGPLLLALVGTLALPGALPVALIWVAHIGMDRAVGYGLKYGAAFGYTHLGYVGSAARRG